mgnify:CR=1 FL=1
MRGMFRGERAEIFDRELRNLADAVPALHGAVKHRQSLDVGFRIMPVLPGCALRLYRPVATLPRADHVRRESRPLGCRLD